MISKKQTDLEEPPKKIRPATILWQLLFILIIIGCSAALAIYYLRTSPRIKPQINKPHPPLVQVKTVEYHPHQLIIEALGTVLAAKKVNLRARVSGEITAMNNNLMPGGILTKDELLITIDSTDYELAVREFEAELAKRQSDLDMEMGRQLIAKREYEIHDQDVTEAEKKLMLRQPQLEAIKAALRGVQARLDQRKINLERSKVKAPFNGIVLKNLVNVGANVSSSTTLAELVNSDEFWIQLTLPVDQLKWINFPTNAMQQGDKVRIFSQGNTDDTPFRIGHILRLAASLEKKGRMATVYVLIKDPLCLLPGNSDKSKLLLGSFVRAQIYGRELASVVAVDRNHIRDGNTVWLMSDKDTLEIRQVDIVAKNREQVFIEAGIVAGERLVTSNFLTPVAGISLELQGKAKGESHKNEAVNVQQSDDEGNDR